MQHGKITKLTIRENDPTSVSSSLHGANLNTFGFNADYIARRDPVLYSELQKLYEKAYKLRDKPPLDKYDKKFTLAHDHMLKGIGYTDEQIKAL